MLVRLDEKVKTKRLRRRRIAAGSATTAAVLLVVAWLVPLLRDTGTIITAPGQRQTITLADGSRAELNARTSLHVDFRYGRRRLRLESGEVFFSVVKDSAHPFLVETPRGTVRVTGTLFNVRLAGEDRPEVTLLHGAVLFEPRAAAPIALAPGQQLTTDGVSPRVHDLPSADLENLTAWRQGRLVLDGLTLADTAARLASFHGVSINVSPAVAPLRPGGTVPLANLRSVLEALQETLPIRVEQQKDGSVQIMAR